MKPSEAKARETREWLGKAAEDLASARVLIGSGHFANALFLCQQAAEKSLKGFLTWHERVFRRTHDLEELGEACRTVDGSLAALLEQADNLSDYAWNWQQTGKPASLNWIGRRCCSSCGIFGTTASRRSVRVEIEAEIASGAPDNFVRTVTENCRTLQNLSGALACCGS